MDPVDEIDGVLPVNQARSRHARDRLLHAGERVFARLGYDAAHVSDIAQAAGCSVGSFYRRFRDKEAFFKALHQRFTERNIENAARFFAMPQWQDEPTAVMVRTLIENTANIMKRNHGFFRALFQRTLAGAANDFWPRMRAGTQRQGELLAEFLRARGEGTHENLTEACIFALRSVDGVLVHRLLNEPASDDAFALDSLSRMALAFLGIPDVPEEVRGAVARRAARSADGG
ncbi:MAG TPA: TetR/AcrR family transcriptional regulator [Rhizomicrobium sp.]|nr:TetR/AcrR family transcriptional regulator [Rhizomicrobium sp.]